MNHRPINKVLLIFPPMFDIRHVDTMFCPPMGIAYLGAFVDGGGRWFGRRSCLGWRWDGWGRFDRPEREGAECEVEPEGGKGSCDRENDEESFR